MTFSIKRTERFIDDPPLVHRLLSDTSYAWVWVPVRFYLAYAWLRDAVSLLQDPAWRLTGEALRRMWLAALGSDSDSVLAFGAYQPFIQVLVKSGASVWVSRAIIGAEVVIGLGLLLGAFTGIAAFGGTLLPVYFMLIGSPGEHPISLGLATLLVLAWKVCGYWGLDRYLLPAVGIPWYLEWNPRRRFLQP